MIVAGCDIGSLTAKAVIMQNDKVLSSAVMQAKTRPSDSANAVIKTALEEAGLSMDKIAYTVGTGYGKEQIPFVNQVESEISCHAKGVMKLMPSARMVIDIGGQDAKATRMEDDGKIVRYIYNDKCATGTGRFLEVMAEALEVSLEDLGSLSEESTEKLTISSQCVIFAETEVISLVNEGKKGCDIVNALHHSLAKRVSSMARSIEVSEDIVMTGGVAKNKGVFKALSDALNIELKSVDGLDPQIIGAYGAALYALENADN